MLRADIVEAVATQLIDWIQRKVEIEGGVIDLTPQTKKCPPCPRPWQSAKPSLQRCSRRSMSTLQVRESWRRNWTQSSPKCVSFIACCRRQPETVIRRGHRMHHPSFSVLGGRFQFLNLGYFPIPREKTRMNYGRPIPYDMSLTAIFFFLLSPFTTHRGKACRFICC